MKLNPQNQFAFGGILLMLSLWACDPGHQGELYVQNDTAVELHYIQSINDTLVDTVRIAPGAIQRIVEFGGLGAGKGIACCPCEMRGGILQPADSNFSILRDMADADHWQMDNPNRRMNDHKMITCVFRLTNADILIVD